MSGCQRQHVREGSKVGEGEDRGLRWGWRGSCPCPGRSVEGGTHEAVVSQARTLLLPQWMQLWALCAGPRMSPLPLRGLCLLPIHIYLFIDFYEVSLPSNPYCSCCPDHPPSHPAVCAAVCLSQGK